MATQAIRNYTGHLRADGFITKGRRGPGIRVINKTGSDIAVNKIVAVSGWDSTSGLLKIILASNAVTGPVDLYVTKSAIGNGKSGTVYKGFVSTASLDTSGATSVGDPVYLGATAGAFSATVVSDRVVGFVKVKSATVGSVVWDILPAFTSTELTTTGTIASADITGTAAGQLGHANGVIMVPAPGTHVINQLVSCVLINAFSTAAYTAGGNVTVNIGGGGAALTGLVANTAFIQLAANGIVELVPLAATKNVYTENNPLNLVSSVAPTQPGTAAGVFRYIVTYRQIATGL
jgi:hypothetical protein